MKQIVIVMLLFLSINAFTCSMFTKTVDGKTLVANNEDWKNTDPVVWIQPGEGEKYDCMFVGFGDVFPQGGMNEAGLCFDGFATESKPVTESLNKPVFEGNMILHIMETCGTVDEVIIEFNKYNLQYLEPAMLMFVDQIGDSVIIEGDEYIRKEGDFQIITNFYQSEVKEGEETGCARFDNLLSQLPDVEVTIEGFTKALATTHAEGKYPTQYSNIFDTNKLEMYLYRYHDYSNYLTFNLKEEMKLGRHVIEMKDIFPKLYAYDYFVNQSKTFAMKLQEIIDQDGLQEAIEAYPELREQKKTVYSYPLNEGEMNLMGYSYLTTGKIDEAIALLKINVENFPESWNCYDSLGEAYMKAGKTELAIWNYEKSIELNPENAAGMEFLKKLKDKKQRR